MKKVLLLPLILFLFSCQTAEEKRAKEAEQQALEAQQGLQEGLKQMENLAQGLQNGENAPAKEPVNFRELKALLPAKVAGMEQSNLEGETTGMTGFTISQASADYRKDEKSIDIQILDVGGAGAALIGMAAWSMATIDKETSEGYEKTGTLDGYKSFEQFTNDGKNGSLSLLVSNRFMVQIEGNGADMSELKSAAQQIDLKKLSKLE